ncbi:MAG: hypothetical protein ABL962_18710, partial [Fimbriimonadaceae bacterium]
MLAQSATTSVRDALSNDKTENRRQAPHPFTQFPNALYALLPQLNGSETKVLWVILRYTFGFQAHYRPAAISLSKFEREAGLTRETVSKALHSLVLRGMVERHGKATQRRSYSVIVRGPALVGKSDQALVKKSGQTRVGKSDHIKESSSGERIPAKEDSSGQPVKKRNRNAEEWAPSFLSEDDVVARLSKPRDGLSAEQELAEIVREKTGLPMRRTDLCRIKENLELRNTNLESFVNEVRSHQNGHWRNPIGLLMSLSTKIGSQMQLAVPLQATERMQKC